MTRMMRGQSRRGRRSGERGVAAVEFALVLPVLLMLVLGSIDWGFFLFVEQVVTNASREGARAGSVIDPAAADSVATTAADAAAREYLQRAGLASTGGTVSVGTSVVDIGGVSAVRVVVSYAVGTSGSLTGFLQALMPDNARGTAVMRWQ